MALCPHCHHVLPDAWVSHCPNCGGDPQVPRATPAGFGAPAGPPPLAPSAALPPGGGPGTPWDQRDRIGFFNALVETTRQVLLSPGDFFRGMPPSGGIGSPLLYAVVIGWIGLVAAALYQALFRSIVGSRFAAFTDRPELASALALAEGWAGFAVQVVFGAVFVVIGVFIAAGILHLMLLLLGGARRGFEATFRVVCYSQATALLLVIPLFLIPFCGLAVVAWCLALYVIGLACAHRIGYGQSLAAVLLPLVALCCCCVGLVATFAGALAGLAGHLR
jgi:hypothetical protein